MQATEKYYQDKILELEAAIQRIRDLHTPVPLGSDWIDFKADDLMCRECFRQAVEEYASPWPCDTILALDGEQA